MALSSMTGFARGHGVAGAYAWAWEIKSVNSKGLDLKLRLPPGWDAVEAPVRARAAEVLSRGSVFANLTVSREGAAPVARVNEPVLDAVLAALKACPARSTRAPPSLDGILALKGVMEVSEAEESEDERRAAETAVVAGFGEAVAGLAAMRRVEGRGARPRADGAAVGNRGAGRSAPTPRRGASPRRSRRGSPSRSPTLLEASQRFDPDRLHQEAILLATKADIREELDRLAAHVAQAKKLHRRRRPDRAQARLPRRRSSTANRIRCAPRPTTSELTNIGLELKAVVEQFREQVQNLE